MSLESHFILDEAGYFSFSLMSIISTLSSVFDLLLCKITISSEEKIMVSFVAEADGKYSSKSKAVLWKAT